jgi:hypothetical protein
MRALLAAFAVMVVSLASTGVAMAQTAIAEGQVWTFKNAPAETARVVIMRIEPYGDGEAVHVSIYGLPTHPAPFDGTIAHMPFERSALEASLSTLMDETPRVDLPFSGGYRMWRDDHGGVWTLSIREAIATVMKTMLDGRVARSR